LVVIVTGFAVDVAALEVALLLWAAVLDDEELELLEPQPAASSPLTTVGARTNAQKLFTMASFVQASRPQRRHRRAFLPAWWSGLRPERPLRSSLRR
jgi:hypothetical protein